jgi:hypothetical protein
MQDDWPISERARRILLELLSSGLRGIATDIPSLTVDEWRQLGDIAGKHRLGPMLHRLSAARDIDVGVPVGLRAQWHADYRQSALASLAAKGTLIRISRALNEGGIAYAALKGAWLAWRGYEDPALRPMRDIDILVSPRDLEATYRVLVANGLEESTGRAFWEETLTSGLKHLPALRDRATGVYAELHGRLFEHIEVGASLARLARPEDLLAAREWQALDKERIAYLSAADNLLHLIVHCIYEHRFDNGPQVLHDLAALLSRQPVDWERFWIDAQAGGWSRGCELLLCMAERMNGSLPISWRGESAPALPGQVIEAATMLLLQDPDQRRDLDVQREISSLGSGSLGKARDLLARLLPPRRVVAAYAGLPVEQRRAWLYYPAWLVSRLARTVRGSLDQSQQSEARRANVIDSWLEAG